MGTEIERKFLLRDDSWRTGAQGTLYRQGYLSSTPGRTVRVRVAGQEAWLTIKGPMEGLVRAEYEYPLPLGDAIVLLANLCEPALIEKTRYEVTFSGDRWEIDEFHGANEGLVVAELELERADQSFQAPRWLGAEVSDNPMYFNSRLAKYPYKLWKTL